VTDQKNTKSSGTTRKLQSSGNTLDDYPLAVLAGGLAIGAIAGAVLPRTERETELLGPLGKRINDGAVAASRAAREAGKAELDNAGISRDAARDTVNRLVDGLLSAASSAGGAAAKAAVDRK
jgi:hypothetical protein